MGTCNPANPATSPIRTGAHALPLHTDRPVGTAPSHDRRTR
jgi:hypothetical protein